jgi:hypothetical protein
VAALLRFGTAKITTFGHFQGMADVGFVIRYDSAGPAFIGRDHAVSPFGYKWKNCDRLSKHYITRSFMHKRDFAPPSSIEKQFSGMSHDVALVIVPTAAFALVGFYCQMLPGTVQYHTFLVGYGMADESVVAGLGFLAYINEAIPLHDVLPF